MEVVELAGAMQKTLHESLQETITELLQNSHDNVESSGRRQHNLEPDHGPSHQDSGSGAHRYQSRAPYACGTRLARIDFPNFTGENVNQWIYQCDMYFAIDLTYAIFVMNLSLMSTA